MTQPIKPVRCWVLRSPYGALALWAVGPTKQWVLDKVESHLVHSWTAMQKAGWRVVRCRLVPEDPQ